MTDYPVREFTKRSLFAGPVAMRYLTVLLAEDDDELRSLLALAFREEGHAVVECGTGVELADHLAGYVLEEPDEKFDIVISDLRMPGVNGMEILKGMHEWREFPPVILITAFGDDETHAEARQHGAAAVLDKPFAIPDLLSEVHAVMESRT